jgi:hypothetical protein
MNITSNSYYAKLGINGDCIAMFVKYGEVTPDGYEECTCRVFRDSIEVEDAYFKTKEIPTDEGLTRISAKQYNMLSAILNAGKQAIQELISENSSELTREPKVGDLIVDNSAVSKIMSISDFIYLQNIVIANNICLYAEFRTDKETEDVLGLHRAKDFRLMERNIVFEASSLVSRTSKMLVEQIKDYCR